jgi:hypothetical protein
MLSLMELTHENGVVRRPLKKPISAPIFRVEPVIGAAYELDKYWDFVCLGIEEVISKSHLEGLGCYKGKPTGFRCTERAHFYYRYKPEDVYLALRTNRASLYMTWLRGKLTGFGICQQVANPEVNEAPYLLSWIGYSRDHETVGLYFRELENLARRLNLHEIRYYTTRKGWIVNKPTPDWEILTCRGWVRDLDHRERLGLRLAPEIVMRRVV